MDPSKLSSICKTSNIIEQTSRKVCNEIVSIRTSVIANLDDISEENTIGCKPISHKIEIFFNK